MNIDDPMFGRFVEGGPFGGHQKWSYEFNKEWEQFINDFPNANKEQVLEFMNKIRCDERFQ